MTVRGATFTTFEDEALAKAWISASEDPIVGAEQKGNEFFSKVQTLYNDKFKPGNKELRSLESLKVRCRGMHKQCMKFAGCHARIVRSNPSGVSGGDFIRMATGVYNGVDMENVDDDFGKPFKFMSAWKILRSHQKFMGALEELRCGSLSSSKSRKDVGQGSIVLENEEEENTSVDESKQERPIGRKRAKDAHCKREQDAKKLKLAKESVLAQQERNKALQRHYEILLFTSGPQSGNNEDAIEYFCIMRARAVAEVRKEISPSKENTVEDEVTNENNAGATLIENESNTASSQ